MLNRRYADHRHGTGVQMKLFADQLLQKPFHICWDHEQTVVDTYQPVVNLNTSWLRDWPFSRGRGLVNRLETILGRTWHQQTRLARRTKQFVGANNSKPRAYVIIASEEEARIARTILETLDAEYAVNVMDYLHLDSERNFPEFAAVLKGAKKIFALTPPIRDALVGISNRDDISILGIAREPAKKSSSAYQSGTDPLEIVMMGSVDYTRGLDELHRFCDGLAGAGTKFRLNYIGTRQMRERLGTQLPVNYRGVQLGADRDAILNTMHLAYLPGPDGDPSEDYLARYSFPSRSADYFWHGLPVIGPLFEKSATAQMVAELLGKGVWFSCDSQQLVSVVKNLSINPRQWTMASEAVHDFAQKHFAMERTAKTIWQVFEN